MRKKRESYDMTIQLDEKQLDKEILETRNSLSTDRLDMSFGEIMAMYERKELIIAPEFQRLYRWDEDQKTKFMESIILGIPIPPIFVAEDKEGRWELVDGLQRISTILSFFGLLVSPDDNVNNWLLTNADLLPAMEGFSSQTIPLKYLLNIKRSVCRIEIIKWDSKWDMRYELFSRLNTGGAPLTDQEIRNSIFRGGLTNFYSFIDKTIKDANFKKITELSSKQKLELFDQELVVRYVALVDKWKEVDTSISLYATSFMRNMLESKKDIEASTISRFNDTVALIAPIGKKAFRIRTVFSPSAYDAIMIATTHYLDYFKKNPAKLEIAVSKLKEDDAFRATRSMASSKSRTKKKIEVAMSIFGDFVK